MRNLDAGKLVEEVLSYLVHEKGWQVIAYNTGRYIDSDGWFELQFELRSPDCSEEIYLVNYTSHDREFEEEWTAQDVYKVDIDDIYWNDKDGWDSGHAMMRIRKNNKAWRDLTTELRKKVKTLLCSDPNGFWKKEFYYEQN